MQPWPITIAHILSARLAGARNAMRLVNRQSRLKVAFILLFGVGMWVGIYACSRAAFFWMADQNEIVAGMVTEFVFDLFFFALGAMLLISNVLLGYSALFGSDEALFLQSKPVNRKAVFICKGADTLAFSSWAAAALWLPLIVAYGVVHKTGFTFYAASCLILAAYMLLLGAAGGLINILAAAFFPQRRKALVIVILFAVTIVAGVFCLKVVESYRSTERIQERWMGDIPMRFSFLRGVLLPSRWASQATQAAAAGDSAALQYHFTLLGANALFACGLFFAAGVLWYERGWDRIQSAKGGRRGRTAALLPLLRLVEGRRSWTVLAKDAAVFLRDPSQWLQFAILLGLMLAYILNLRAIGYGDAALSWRVLIASLNFFATIMVLATLSTRFFFPLVSLEGKRFWILGLAPMTRREILSAKFSFAFACNLLLAEGLLFLSNTMLKLDWQFLLAQAGMAALASAALAGLAVGLGAAFPDFKADSPSEAVSGFGGTLCMILSAGYVFIIVIAQSGPAFMWVRGGFAANGYGKLALAATIMILLSALAARLPLALGAKNLDQAEF